MELMDAIKGRRSIRRYRPDPVPDGLVREALEAARWAPSAKNGQQWRFTVLTGESKAMFIEVFRAELEKFVEKFGREASGSAFSSCRIMEEAPVNVIVWNAGEHGWTTEEHSVAASIQNVLLRAHDLGLGSLWIGDVYYAYEGIREYFGKRWKLSGAVALGYPAMEGRNPPKMPVDQVAEFLT
jgi:nitroreductase